MAKRFTKRSNFHYGQPINREAMKGWQLPTVIIREAGGGWGDFEPWRAEALVDDWFRDDASDDVLRDICSYLRCSARGRAEQRNAVKLALRARRLRADRLLVDGGVGAPTR